MVIYIRKTPSYFSDMVGAKLIRRKVVGIGSINGGKVGLVYRINLGA